MNISTISDMVKNGDLSLGAAKYLIDCKCECECLDFKEDLYLDNDYELCEFARDALAFKNIGGGYIVIGVKDKTWEFSGMSYGFPYDSKMLRDKVNKATSVDLDINMTEHKIEIENEIKKCILILIRSSRKRSKLRTPSISGKDFKTEYKHGIRRGDIYFRKGDQTVKMTKEEELEEILNDLEQKEQTARLEDGKTNPFFITDGSYRLLEKGYDSFIGRDETKNDFLKLIKKDPRIWIINVHGAGGVGKSALVNWAVHYFYHEQSFESILQLTAKDTVLSEYGIVEAKRNLFSVDSLIDNILQLFGEDTEIDLIEKRKIALDYLNAWEMLIVLDNMETVHDDRIMEFIREFPPTSKSKVILTSRTKTSGWELAFPLKELSKDEALRFLSIKAKERGISFPLEEFGERCYQASGGLPLALQWILGQYTKTKNISGIIERTANKDSPVLEFSFRNIWNILSREAKEVLAILPIFDSSPTSKELAIALNQEIDRVDQSLSELQECTLVNKTPNSDGYYLYTALPITLNFAKNMLKQMGLFELECQQRYQKYNSQILLHEVEIQGVQSMFSRLGVKNEIEKKAIILIRRAETEIALNHLANSDSYIKDALDLAPTSTVVLAMAARLENELQRITS